MKMVKRKVKVRKLDLSKADGYVVTDAQVIYGAVQKEGLDGKPLLYSGLEGENLATLLEHGTVYLDSNCIFASTMPDEDERHEQHTPPLVCAFEKNIPMLAVYDETKFDCERVNTYHFKDPNNKLGALLVVYLLEG